MPVSNGRLSHLAGARVIVEAPRHGRRVQWEYCEQCAFIEWCELQFFQVESDGRRIEICLADAVEASLNGAHLQGNTKQRAAQWARMKKAGAKKSAADLTVNIPAGEYQGLKIEMKRARSQFASDAAVAKAVAPGQLEYLQLMRRLGYKAVVCYGWVEAATEACIYLGWSPRSKGLC